MYVKVGKKTEVLSVQWASLVAQKVKNLPAMQKLQEMLFRSLGWEDSLEEGVATYSNIIA